MNLAYEDKEFGSKNDYQKRTGSWRKNFKY
jgi:hypothetical protein